MGQTETTPSATPTPPKKRRRWRRLFLALSLLLALAVFFRAPLLRGVAGFLNVDEPPEPAEYVLIMGGDGAIAEAARYYRAGLASQVLLLEMRHHRLERLGILPTGVEILQRALTADGVPSERIAVIDAQVGEGWDFLRRVGAWLDERPAAHVTLLTDQFSSRSLRYRLRTVLVPAAWKRVHIHTLPHRWYDETNWWRRKEGVLQVYHGYLRLTQDRVRGEDREPWRDWDLEGYKQALRSAP